MSVAAVQAARALEAIGGAGDDVVSAANPLPRRRADEASDEHRFFLRVSKTVGCWPWIGPLCDRGYGKFNTGKRYIRAHRWIWQHMHGAIASKIEVRHRCDNPKCVNPDHLELGTHQQNMADMTSRNRQAKGSAVGKAKLTESAVVEARQAWRAGTTIQSLSEQHGTDPATMSRALRGITWKHV